MAMSFEGQRRAIGQFLRVQPVFQLGQGRNLGCIAAIACMTIDIGSVGFSDNGFQISRRNIRNELGENFVGQIGVRQLAPGIKLATTDLRVVFRQIEATVRGQAAKENVAEKLGRGVAASRDIAHGKALKCEKRGILPRGPQHAHGLQQAKCKEGQCQPK
jgi:hypothetical protein